MNRIVSRAAIAALAVVIAAAPLLASPADAVRARVAGFKDLGRQFKSATDGIRASNVQQIQQAAPRIVAASRAMNGWFPRGSGPSAGVKTDAKPEIWTRAPQFRAAQGAFAAQAAAFQRAAASGNMEAITAEARKLGGTCKSCHDSFRNRS